MAQIKDISLLKKIALVLKQLRDQYDLSQEEFYNETNIHIGRIETAKTNVSISTLAAICSFFEISLVDFFKKVDKV